MFKLLAFLIFVSLLQRLLLIDFFWLSPDEGLYYTISAEASYLRFIALADKHAHPLLFYRIVRFIASLTESPFAPRILSVIAGSATIPLLAYTCFRAVTLATGRVHTALIAGSSAAILAGTNGCLLSMSLLIRPYATVFFLTSLLLVLVTLVKISRHGMIIGVGLLSATAVAAVSIHYAAFFVVGTILGSGVIANGSRLYFGNPSSDESKELKSELVIYLMTSILVILTASFFWWTHISHFQNTPLWTHYQRDVLAQGFITTPLSAATIWSTTLAYIIGKGWAIAIPMYFLGVIYTFKSLRNRSLGITLLSLPLVTTLLACLGKYPLGAMRYQSIFVPFWLVGISLGIALIAHLTLNHSPRLLRVAAMFVTLLSIIVASQVTLLSYNKNAAILRSYLPGREQMLTTEEFTDLMAKLKTYCQGDCSIATDLASFFTLAPYEQLPMPPITPPVYAAHSSLGAIRVLQTWILGGNQKTDARALKDIKDILANTPITEAGTGTKLVFILFEWDAYPLNKLEPSLYAPIGMKVDWVQENENSQVIAFSR